MLKLFLAYFVGLFAIVDPAAAVPIWISLTKNEAIARRKSLAATTAKYVFAILICFLFVGHAILQFFGISLLGMKIAGGIMLIINALELLHGHKGQTVPLTEDRHSIAFTPMAMPLLSGPGAIAVILGIGGDLGYVWDSPINYTIAALAIILVCMIVYAVLSYSHYIQRLVGDTLLHAVTLFMGFFLLCIGIQFLVDSLPQVLRG